jgi:hypothetical protein
MSAFMCSDKHLSAIVAFAVKHHIVPEEEAVATVGMLARENRRSLSYRYGPDHEPARLVFYRPPFPPLSPVEIVKACDCYDYQACESPDYSETEAARLVNRIARTAAHKFKGWEEAAWEVA